MAVKLGNLGDKVWPAVALYQYERATGLMVELDSAATVYVGDGYQLKANVRPNTYTGGVKWSSDAPEVATVDENGLLTAHKAGTATITANGTVVVLYDATTGETYSLSSSFPYESVCAIAMAGDSTYTDAAGQTHDSRIFYVLGKDGTRFEMHVWAIYGSWQRNNVDYAAEIRIAGNVGLTFQDRNNVTMTYVWEEKAQGLVVAGGGNETVSLWYLDMTTETLTTEKLMTIPGATGIAGLYTEMDRVPVLPGVQSIAAEQQEDRTLVRPAAQGQVGQNEQTATVTVTLKDEAGKDVAANNGLVEIRYDATVLTLTDVQVRGDYKAVVQEDGLLKFAFADLEAISDVATLTFTVKQAETTEITVKTLEVNTDKPNYTETVTLEFLHENREIRGRIEPTCTTAGYSGDTYCTDCGQLIKKGEILEATGHTYGDWTVTKPATCTEPGEETRFCDDCGARETRPVAATGHSYGDWTLTKAPTCTEAGEETRKCACGETESREIPATGHTYGDWTVTKAATCTEPGEETRTCACGETETRAIAAHGHDALPQVVAPTCTADGYTAHTCQVCGESWRDTIVPALGHQYEAVVTAPTCTEGGYTTYTCELCGEGYIADEVDALGHDWSE